MYTTISSLCRYFSYIMGFFGTIGSLIMASAYGKDLKEGYREIIAVRNWPRTIGIFVGSMISAFVIVIILYALGEILDKLHELQKSNQRNTVLPYTQNINTSTYANTNTVNSIGSETMSSYLNKVDSPSSSDWTCKSCGRVNPSSLRSCKECATYK